VFVLHVSKTTAVCGVASTSIVGVLPSSACGSNIALLQCDGGSMCAITMQHFHSEVTIVGCVCVDIKQHGLAGIVTVLLYAFLGRLGSNAKVLAGSRQARENVDVVAILHQHACWSAMCMLLMWEMRLLA